MPNFVKLITIDSYDFFAQLDNDISSCYFVIEKCSLVILVLVHLGGVFVEMEFLLVSFAAKFTTMRPLVLVNFGNVTVKSVFQLESFAADFAEVRPRIIVYYSLVSCDTVFAYKGLATCSAAELLVVMNGQHVFDKMLFMIVSFAANFVAKISQIFVNMFFVI